MPAADRPIEEEFAEERAADLLALALSKPKECIERALEMIGRVGGGRAPSFVPQALGLAERERGDLATAVRWLRRAVRKADLAEPVERRADVRASLATTLSLAGRTEAALGLLDQAVGLTGGLTRARVRMRRGAVLAVLERSDEALDDLRQAIPVFRRHDDLLWEARGLMSRAIILGERDRWSRADAALARAAKLFRRSGQLADSARALQNRGWLHYRLGHLPTALDFLGNAAELFRDSSVNEPSVEVDICAVLLAAGMPADALHHAQLALALLHRRTVGGTHRAEVELILAQVALAAYDNTSARHHALAGRRYYRTQGRERGVLLAELVEAQARWASGERGGRLPHLTRHLADASARFGASDKAIANLLAGRVALAAGRYEEANDRLAVAASFRSRSSAAPTRAAGWLAYALRADATQSSTDLLRAASHGLRVLDEHRLSLGATELRAAATANGAELGALALRHAKRRRDARELLVWSERWRATTLALPPVRPPNDRELVADLGRLRDVTHKLAEARGAGTSTAPFERERRRLEEAVRARTLQTPGQKETGEQRFEVGHLLDSLGERQLVSIVEVDGELTVLVAAGGRVRKFSAGRQEDAAREVDYARFALRGAAGMGISRAEIALRRLEAGGPRLQQILFGDAVRALGDGPLIIVPPARLHATPWGVLPAMRNRPFAVTPSAASWLRAATRRAPRRRDVVLVAGPNLGSRGAEITTLRRTYEDARVLANGAATCEDVLKALNGAWLAHVAAHGVLRADNPLFSALTLDDGPLTVYDLERLRRAPYRLILSACESGVGTKAGADEVLGLASAVISLGTAGLLGSTVIVDDDAAVEVSLIVHEHLRAGADLAHALYRARQATAGDPVAHATSLAFLALGAA